LIAWLAISLAVREQPAIDDSLLYLVCLAFGEATISGMLMTLLVVYRPSWVATFDDGRYLQRLRSESRLAGIDAEGGPGTETARRARSKPG